MEPAPHPGGEVRGLVETDDGTLWVLTVGALFRRPVGGGWASVGFPGEGTWEGLGLASPDGRHVWISARRTTAGGDRHVILRSRPTPEPLRWGCPVTPPTSDEFVPDPRQGHDRRYPGHALS